MIRGIIVSILLFTMFACSPSLNTAQMTMQEHLDYAMSLYEDEDYQYAVTEFQALILQYPGSAINDDAQFYLGMTYFKKGQYLLAVYEFSKLIRDIPASEFVPESQYMLAESYYELSPHYSLDQQYTKKAIDEFQAFIDFFPTNDKVEDAEQKIAVLNDKLAEKEYNNAVIYERMEYYRAATKYYEEVAEIYHDSKYAPLALYRRANILIQRNETQDAITDINMFLSRYPDNEYAPEMKELLEKLQDNDGI